MEYGLRLTSLAEPPPDPRDVCPPPWRSLLPEGRMVAHYFGSEFCEDLLPDIALAEAFCVAALQQRCEPTLLTPLLTPAGLERVDHLLAGLVANGCRPAVVFNDWGVLGLLRERHASLARRAGRLMNRSLRDPRAYRDAPAVSTSHDASRCRRLRRFLAAAGVCALETDPDLDGGFLGEGPDDGDAGLCRALHLPFTFAASGRNCPLKALRYPQGDGFSKVLADPCPAPCRSGPVTMRRDDSPLPHWRGGNTVFYETPREVVSAWLAHADRIVLHPVALP